MRASAPRFKLAVAAIVALAWSVSLTPGAEAQVSATNPIAGLPISPATGQPLVADATHLPVWDATVMTYDQYEASYKVTYVYQQADRDAGLCFGDTTTGTKVMITWMCSDPRPPGNPVPYAIGTEMPNWQLNNKGLFQPEDSYSFTWNGTVWLGGRVGAAPQWGYDPNPTPIAGTNGSVTTAAKDYTIDVYGRDLTKNGTLTVTSRYFVSTRQAYIAHVLKTYRVRVRTVVNGRAAFRWVTRKHWVAVTRYRTVRTPVTKRIGTFPIDSTGYVGWVTVTLLPRLGVQRVTMSDGTSTFTDQVTVIAS